MGAQDEPGRTGRETAPDPALQAAAAELWQADQLSAQLADVLTAAGAAARIAAGPYEVTWHQGPVGDRPEA